MDSFGKAVVVTALKNMFEEKSYFCICTIDRCIRIMGVVPDGNDYRALSALHCVHWRDMDAEVRQAVFEKTINMLLSNNGFDTTVLDSVFETQATMEKLGQDRKSFANSARKLLGKD